MVIYKNSKILVLLFLLFNLTSCIQAQSEVDEKQAIKMLNEFYSNYINQIIYGPAGVAGEKIIDSLRQQYCTKELLEKIPIIIEKTDGDPFIKGQDCNASCLSTISIVKKSKKEGLFLVTYLDSYSGKTIAINLVIKIENKKYKIDFVF